MTLVFWILLALLLVVSPGPMCADTLSIAAADSIATPAVSIFDSARYPNFMERLTPDSAMWARIAPDTSRTDLAGAMLNIGYRWLRALHKAWRFMGERFLIIYHSAAKIVNRIIRDDHPRDRVIRIPFTRPNR